MLKHEFIEQIEKYKPILTGRGRKTAELAGVTYVTYQNYVKGMASDPVIMDRIINACKLTSKNLRVLLADVES